MFDSTEARRRIGRFAWAMAWFGLVAGQFHAMARHQTADGKSDLESSMTSFWSNPARDFFQPLLDWADPDVVYVTWGKIWLPVFLGFTLCAFVVRRHRQPVGFEKWAWRIALTGYVGGCASVAAEYWSQWTSVDQGVVDAVFLASAPFLLMTMVGSTLLGIALLRRGMRPALPAWLLTLAIPSLIVVSMVTSLGNVVLPIMFAFGILGRRIAAEDAQLSAVPVAARA
jgi:hypothetical protein